MITPLVVVAVCVVPGKMDYDKFLFGGNHTVLVI